MSIYISKDKFTQKQLVDQKKKKKKAGAVPKLRCELVPFVPTECFNLVWETESVPWKDNLWGLQ